MASQKILQELFKRTQIGNKVSETIISNPPWHNICPTCSRDFTRRNWPCLRFRCPKLEPVSLIMRKFTY